MSYVHTIFNPHHRPCQIGFSTYSSISINIALPFWLPMFETPQVICAPALLQHLSITNPTDFIYIIILTVYTFSPFWSYAFSWIISTISSSTFLTPPSVHLEHLCWQADHSTAELIIPLPYLEKNPKNLFPIAYIK